MQFTTETFAHSIFPVILYYANWLLFACWSGIFGAFFYKRRREIAKVLRENRAGWICAFVLSVVVFVSVTPYLRILSDEIHLVSMSHSMIFNHTSAVVQQSDWNYEQIANLESTLPKKPVTFSFILHLLHLLVGYRVGNVFVLNFFVLFAFLTVIYVLLVKWLCKESPVVACCALILVAAQPVVSASAASGGFDLFASLCTLVVFACLKNLLNSPTKENFLLLWAQLLLASTVRHESLALFFIIMGLLAVWGHLPVRYLKHPLVWLATPPIFGTFAAHRALVLKTYPSFFQTPPGISAFSPAHWMRHNFEFLKSLFRFDFYLPYANAVNLLGLIFLAYAVVRMFWKRRSFSRPELHFWLIVLTVLGSLWTVYASIYLGSPNMRLCVRYFVLFVSIFSVLCACGMYRIPWMRKRPYYLVLVAFLIFCFYHRVAMGDRIYSSSGQTRNHNITLEFLRAVPDKHFLLITTVPRHYIIYNMPGIDYGWANRNADDILRRFKQGAYSSIYVIQDVNADTGKPAIQTELDPKYRLETLFERVNSTGVSIRISKVLPPK